MPHSPPPMIAVSSIDCASHIIKPTGTLQDSRKTRSEFHQSSFDAQWNASPSKLPSPDRQTGTKLDLICATRWSVEIDMNVALEFVHCSAEELKALLDGGTLTVYSVARPIT